MHGWWSISLLPSLPLALQGWLWVLLKQLIFPNFWAGTVAACEDVCCLWAPNCFDHISLSVKKFWVHTQYMHVYLFINLWIYCIHALLKFQYFFLHPGALSHVPHLGDHRSRWSQYKWSLEAGGLILARSALFQGTFLIWSVFLGSLESPWFLPDLLTQQALLQCCFWDEEKFLTVLGKGMHLKHMQCFSEVVCAGVQVPALHMLMPIWLNLHIWLRPCKVLCCWWLRDHSGIRIRALYSQASAGKHKPALLF